MGCYSKLLILRDKNVDCSDSIIKINYLVLIGIEKLIDYNSKIIRKLKHFLLK